MKNYESIVIFYPDIEEDVRVGAVERLKGIIESNGSIEEIEEWGDRKFAYEIEYHNHGFYYLFKFQADADTVKEFDGRLDDVPGIFGLMEPMDGAIEAFEKLSENLLQSECFTNLTLTVLYAKYLQSE